MTIKFLRKGQPCPAWLEKIVHTVGCASVVYAKGGAWIWRPLLPGFDCLLHVDGDGGHVSIKGQSPEGGDGGVIMNLRPVLDWPWFVAAAAVCGAALMRL